MTIFFGAERAEYHVHSTNHAEMSSGRRQNLFVEILFGIDAYIIALTGLSENVVDSWYVFPFIKV